MVATWIDEKDLSNDSYTDFDMPYFCFAWMIGQFLLLPTMKCHYGPSLIIMRIKGSGKILEK